MLYIEIYLIAGKPTDNWQSAAKLVYKYTRTFNDYLKGSAPPYKFFIFKGGYIMNKKDASTDSGKYINGIYTTKNGYSGLGLNCPKGTRLYNTENCPIFFLPNDVQRGEEFKMLTDDVAPDIMPYYAISNYGRVENINTQKIMKPNYRPNGYEYLCLAAKNCKHGQKKYTTHRLVLKTFDPRDNMDELEVNHIYADKTLNYVNKIMPDGSLDSGIEWTTTKENIHHAEINGLRGKDKISFDDAKIIRDLHDQGYSYEQIVSQYYPYISSNTVQNVCLNKVYVDNSYSPRTYYDSYKSNPANLHRLTDDDANNIRDLYNHGYKYEEIQNRFYPNFSICTISDIVRGKTHNR